MSVYKLLPAKCFQHSGVCETGLSDFHKLIFTVLKGHHSIQNPKIICFWDYENFNKDHFRIDLETDLDLSLELSFQNVQDNGLINLYSLPEVSLTLVLHYKEGILDVIKQHLWTWNCAKCPQHEHILINSVSVIAVNITWHIKCKVTTALNF